MPYPIFNSLPNLMSATRKRRVTNSPYEINNSIEQQQPELQPNIGGGGNMLNRILSSIAAGVGVGISDNPGQALMQQLAQQRETQLKQQQMQFEAEQQRTQRQFQREMKQTDIAAEKENLQTQLGARQELQTQAERHDVLLNSTKFSQDQELQKQHRDAQISLEKLRNDFTLTRDFNNQDFQLELEEARNAGDIKQIEIKTVMGALLTASKYHNAAPIDKVLTIVDKMQKGIALDKSDTEAINKAIKVNAVISSGGGGSGGSGTVIGKTQQKSFLQLENDRSELVKQYLLRAQEPMVNPATGTVQLDFSGKPVMINKSPEQLANDLKSIVGAFDKFTGFNQQAQTATQQRITPQRTPEGIVDGLFQSGQNLNQIVSAIDSSAMSAEDKIKAKKRLQNHFRVYSGK